MLFFRRVGPGLRPSRRDIGKHTRFRLSPQADSEVEPLLHLPPSPAFLRAEFATAVLRPALKRLNLTQRSQSPCSGTALKRFWSPLRGLELGGEAASRKYFADFANFA